MENRTFLKALEYEGESTAGAEIPTIFEVRTCPRNSEAVFLSVDGRFNVVINSTDLIRAVQACQWISGDIIE